MKRTCQDFCRVMSTGQAGPRGFPQCCVVVLSGHRKPVGGETRTWFDYARDQGIATTNSTSAFPDVALTPAPWPGKR